jgi:hypothetical protein
MIVKYKDEQWRFRIKDVLLHTSIPHRPSLRLGMCWINWKVLSNVGCSPQSSTIKSM